MDIGQRRLGTVALLTAVATALVAAPTAQGAPRAPEETVATVSRYVALGDSYSAAPLVPTLQIAGGCFRSTNNYANVVSRALPGDTFVDRTCSSADTADLTASQLPGTPAQLSAVTADTDLVTLGIGGNDESVFGTLVGLCTSLRASDPTGAPCRDLMRSDGEDRLLAAVARTEDRIVEVVAGIQERAPQARVMLVGYPQIAPSQGTCPGLLPLADGDYHYANQVNKRLTTAVRHAAAQTHVDYVDVWQASQGHDVCSADPWINGQVTDPTRALNYHPFANEQAAVAALILDQLG